MWINGYDRDRPIWKEVLEKAEQPKTDWGWVVAALLGVGLIWMLVWQFWR